MITLKQLDLKNILEEATQKSAKIGVPIMVSYLQDLDSPGPLALFSIGEELNMTRRVYWSDGCGLTYAGIGACAELTATGENRYNNISEQQSHLIKQAIQNKQQAGCGPLIFGGFSFHNEQDDYALWEAFPSAAFFVPSFLLTEKDGQQTLTVNLLVDGNDNPEALAMKAEEDIQSIINHGPITSSKSKLTPNLIKEPNVESWLDAVASATQTIKEGQLGKVVLSRQKEITFHDDIPATHVLQELREQQPDSFVFAVEREGTCFVGATPERLVKKEDDTYLTSCLAGTAPRGHDPESDRMLGNDLLEDDKNIEEHQFVVDMIKDALEKVCDFIDAPHSPFLYKARDVQHLHTPIRAQSNQHTSLLSLVKALHPTPAMGGTPTQEALKAIKCLEDYERGWYASPVGWMTPDGNGDFVVAIRSGLLNGNWGTLFAGCGIVANSTPEAEYNETRMKFRPMLSALGISFDDE